jgi:G6PDH family F420-dependent oxidoreductase
MLREALEIIRLLWRGGYRSYRGKYLQLEDARVFDLPERLPEIAVAAGGPAAARIAAELGDALFATEPDPELVRRYRDAGGHGAGYAEAPLAWAPDEDAGAQAALATNRWGTTGWKVMSELPNPVNFEAATTTVRALDMAAQFACGPDPDRHIEVIAPFVDAGFDRIVLMNAGPDPDGFLDFFQDELADRLGKLGPAA